MISFLSWFLIIFLLGWAATPLTFRLFSALADRGIFFSKILGFLLLGFTFWLAVVTGILRNDTGGILICFGLVILFSALSMRKEKWKEWLAWLKANRSLIISGEVLFLAAFFLMALLRAANPDIIGTEKPMELAFINSILRSPTFPPHDPWLSGYAISYYYFGYVLSAVLIKLSGTASGIGFNLSIALWFALTGLGGYGVLFNLVNTFLPKRKNAASGNAEQKTHFLAPLLAPLFILILGNLEGLLEMLHAAGLFWNKTGGQWTSSFWKFLNIAELTDPPSLPLTLVPNRAGGIWWWRASRVLQDFNLRGEVKEIIDEFPFFSYLLSDLHPHVLSAPFVLLAVAFSLNFYLAYREKPAQSAGFFAWLGRLTGGDAKEGAGPQNSFLSSADFWLGALIFGGLSFLNTWDFPIYVGLFCAVFILVKIQTEGWQRRYILEFIETGLALGLAGVLLYLPFYIGFSSQAGGLLPSLAFFTRGIYFWIMFGIMLVPIFLWLGVNLKKCARKTDWLFGLKIAATLVFGLWLASYGLSLLVSGLVAWAGLTVSSGGPLMAVAGRVLDLSSLFAGIQGAGLASGLLRDSLLLRLASPGTWLTLLAMLTMVFALLKGFAAKKNGGAQPANTVAGMHADTDYRALTPFVLVLVLIGAGLTLFPEFFYLRDQFGWRMNTIFKFYFETWILWSLAAAYALIRLWTGARSSWRVAGSILCLSLVICGMAYPIFGVATKTNNLKPVELTLDGNAYRIRYSAGEMQAIEFLQKAPLGVVAEAIGGSYSSFGRVSMISGQPTVLGWPGHESQWRGGSKEMGSREKDIETLYHTADWGDALAIIQRYQIRYIFVGSLEESAYRVNRFKFDANLPPVFRNDSTTIYEVPDNLLTIGRMQ